jgi:Ni,Fe-hydrogenase III large subunit
LRSGVRPGGAALESVPRPHELDAIGDEVHELVALAMASSVLVDRFAGTSVLARQAAVDMGTLGYVARASGFDVDARRDHPFCPRSDALTIPTQTGGDVMARFQQRVQEIDVSLALLRDCLERLDGTSGEGTTVGPARRSGLGVVEGWRGAIVHRVEVGGDGRLRRVKVVDPSFFNWPALPVALSDTIVPDFPVTNKSFNLSYAGNDL